MNNYFNRTKLFLLLIATSLFVACTDQKDYYDPDFVTDNPIEDVTVPDGFNWKTTLSNNVTVEVDDEFNGQYNYLIEVFDMNPVTNPDAKVITNGTAKKDKPFVTKMTVPNNVENVFIRRTTPTGLASVRSESTTTGTINCNFGKVNTKSSRSGGVVTRAGDWDVDFTAPDPSDRTYFPTAAPADATVIVSGTKITENGVYIINSNTPSSFSPGSIKNLTFYVTENATISKFDNLIGRQIFILPNVSFTVTAGIAAQTADWIITIGENAELKTGSSIAIEHNTLFYNLGTVTASSFKGIRNSVLYNTGGIYLSDTGTTAISMGSTGTLLYNVGNIEAAGGLYITSGSTVYNSGSASLKTGSMNIESSGNRFINDGDVVCAGRFRVAGTSKTQNNGTLTVGGETEVSGGETWHNNGTWTTKTMTTKAYAGRYLNSCKLIVEEKFYLEQANFINDAGAYVYATSVFMKNTRIELGSASFFHVDGVADFNNNAIAASKGFYGIGEQKALLKMTKATSSDNSYWSMVHYFGNMQVACDDHVAQRPNANGPWSLNDGAEFASSANNTVKIEPTSCNEGSEVNPGTPEDKDPKPIVDPFSYTYLFEDLWPVYGDYDMNDVVIRINEITKTPDEDGNITSLSFDFNLKAVGAARSVAVGLMLDGVNTSSVVSLTYSGDKPEGFATLGSGVESEQTMTVIPLISEVHRYLGKKVGQFINTIVGSGDNISETPTMTVKVTFASPIEDKIDATSLNVFIVADSDNGSLLRSARKEIHVVGYAPTARANTFMFGNHNDNSLSGLYYTSKDNLAWGIVVADDFSWPVEYRNIQKAYSGFTEWIQSGGENNKDWWTTPENGAVF